MSIRTVYVKASTTYWKLEEFLHKASFYVVPVFFLIFIFFGFAQIDYVKNRHKRDLTALPIEKQQRYEFVKKEELRLWAAQSAANQDFDFEKVKEIDGIRGPLNIERNVIYKSAPHTSWAYHFYVAIGAIKPF